MQYQSLMEARPQGLLEMLEPMLVRHVAIAGALHCLPFLVTLPSMLPNISDEELRDVCEYTLRIDENGLEEFLTKIFSYFKSILKRVINQTKVQIKKSIEEIN